MGRWVIDDVDPGAYVEWAGRALVQRTWDILLPLPSELLAGKTLDFGDWVSWCVGTNGQPDEQHRRLGANPRVARVNATRFLQPLRLRSRLITAIGGTRISLPRGLTFATGGPASLKSCPSCPEPDRPAGLIFGAGPDVGIEITRRYVVGGGVLFTSAAGDFRSGVIDRQRWPAPGEGEAYVYSRVTSLGRVPFVTVGAVVADDPDSRIELGLRSYWLSVRIEQGYDRYNAADPRREVSGNGLALSPYFQVGFQRGLFVSFDLGPFGKLDFGQFGQGRVGKGFVLAAGYNF